MNAGQCSGSHDRGYDSAHLGIAARAAVRVEDHERYCREETRAGFDRPDTFERLLEAQGKAFAQLTRWLHCPGARCHVQLPDDLAGQREQYAHMSAEHPALIAKRLHDAGLEPVDVTNALGLYRPGTCAGDGVGQESNVYELRPE